MNEVLRSKTQSRASSCCEYCQKSNIKQIKIESKWASES
jgi:hypothetical protein